MTALTLPRLLHLGFTREPDGLFLQLGGSNLALYAEPGPSWELYLCCRGRREMRLPQGQTVESVRRVMRELGKPVGAKVEMR